MPIAIQVKTASQASSVFQVGEKGVIPSPAGSREWYVLVQLGEPGERPAFFIVPRTHVAATAWINHEDWIAHPKRDGSERLVNTMRHTKRQWVESYRDRFELLHEPPDQVPWLLGDGFWKLLARHPLPEEFGKPLRSSG